MTNSDTALLVLYEVRKFVKDQEIYCPELIYQSDIVIENAYEFIERLCNIAGYHEDN